MSGFKMELPDNVRFIIRRLNESGYSAHVVGGSVRDSLIGRELGDFDITTNALPSETKAAFSDFKTVDTGIKHGTVTVVIDSEPYEITTYRVDGDYKDNRHPDSVTFTSRLEEDLARRDFTVNAMAYDPDRGLIDPFDGRFDAEAKIIRAVGDPYVRFDEDALRILRGLRFASVLGFCIEENTAFAARSLSQRLSSISKERVYAELKKLLSGKHAHGVISEYQDVLTVALGGFSPSRIPCKESFDRADYLTRLCSVFYLNSDDPCNTAEAVLAALKTDKLTRTYTKSVLSAYDACSFDSMNDTLKALYKYGEETVKGAVALGALLGRYGERESELLSSSLVCNIPYKLSDLAVRGSDLSALGIYGARVGEALGLLLLAVIDGRVENKKDALLDYVAKAV